VHEKNLEQTTSQTMQLEQQIYSIEAANINHETLQAMKQAGAAMKQIHGGMKLEDVDKTMYVFIGFIQRTAWVLAALGSGIDTDVYAGRISRTSMRSTRKSETQLPVSRSANSPTRKISRPNWRVSSRRLWTRRCSTLALYLLALNWIGYQLREMQNVCWTWIAISYIIC
jgi:hypothetical protein